MISGEQIRAACGMLKWSARLLAEQSGVSLSTAKRLQMADGVPAVSARTLDAVRRAIERAGVAFIPENGGGVGVRFRERAK